jgi:hypothetical protein
LRSALLAFAVLIVISPLASAVTRPDEWTVDVPSTTYFSGDWVNVTVTGYDPPSVPFLYFNVTNPNGTLVDQRYVQVVNGTANFSMLLGLDAPTGKWILNCTANASLVSQIGFEVVFDELNYLAKRVALLEKENQEQSRKIETQRIQLREFGQMVAWYWLIPIEVGILFVVIGWWFWTIVLPTWRLVHDWYYPIGDRLKLRVRIISVLIGRYGASDQRAYYPALRVAHLPIETDPIYRAARRLKGLEQEDIPRSAQLQDPPIQKPVRPVRRPGGSS